MSSAKRTVLLGREHQGFVCLADVPQVGLGPLGGLNAALRYAAANHFTHVLSAGVDAPNLPHDVAHTLTGHGAAIIENQPVVGLWPSDLSAELDTFLADGGRALFAFADKVEARRVTLTTPLLNINHPADLGEQS